MKYLAPFFAAVCTFLMPIGGLLLTMIAFVGLDTVTGIYASVRLNGWKSFSSTKLFNVVVKTVFYQSSIIMAYFLDDFVFEGEILGVKLLLAKATTAVWVYIEVKSCDENSVKLGNRSLYIIIKDILSTAKELKKDLNDVQNDE